jgi:hypothetical protein
MENCIHEKIVQRKITKTFLGEKFETRTSVCEMCSAELWDQETQKAFSNWLSKLDRNKRD